MAGLQESCLQPAPEPGRGGRAMKPVRIAFLGLGVALVLLCSGRAAMAGTCGCLDATCVTDPCAWPACPGDCQMSPPTCQGGEWPCPAAPACSEFICPGCSNYPCGAQMPCDCNATNCYREVCVDCNPELIITVACQCGHPGCDQSGPCEVVARLCSGSGAPFQGYPCSLVSCSCIWADCGCVDHCSSSAAMCGGGGQVCQCGGAGCYPVCPFLCYVS